VTATLHPLPTRSEPELTAARASLANASRELRDELEAFEAVTAPAQRLGQLSVDLTAIDAEIAEVRSAHDAVLGIWLAQGQVGERSPAELENFAARAPPGRAGTRCRGGFCDGSDPR
jgi:hypothetical protein